MADKPIHEWYVSDVDALVSECKRLRDERDQALKQASMWETTSLCQAAEIDRLHQEIDRLLQLL